MVDISSLTFSTNGNKSSNYNFSSSPGSVIINPAPLAIALNATYNGTTSFIINNSSGTGNTLGTSAAPIYSTSNIIIGGVMVSGLVNGETINALTIAYPNVSNNLLLEFEFFHHNSRNYLVILNLIRFQFLDDSL